MMVMISVSVRCRSKTLYIIRSFRSLWQKPNLQRTQIQGQRARQRARRRTETSLNHCSKLVASKDKEVNQAAGDSDDALVYCVENTVEDRIMDSGASFHATYCKEDLERFKLRSGKVRLADDETLDIAGVRDVVLRTSFGKNWTLKDVRYIPSLKIRLISVEQLDEEDYHDWYEHVSFQSNVPDVWMVDIYFCKPDGLGKQRKLSFIMSVKTRKLQREHEASYRGSEDVMADSVSTTYLIYCIPYVKDVCGKAMKCTFIGNDSDEVRYNFQDTKSHQVI
nr:retrovirus-related Pol polyprotein from transposon TNT 1-94 [Tanacetum cinerariifolium]